MLKASEFIQNQDGSIYHLNLLPKDIAKTIIFVGDPERVSMVSTYFDEIEIQKQKREFITHTGRYQGKRITVISTGIGTGNIDIVLNELDALVNIDFDSKTIKKKQKSLNIIRIGTSGALQKEIKVDSFLISEAAIGFDGLLNFYKQKPLQNDFFTQILNQFSEHWFKNSMYFIQANEQLLKHFSSIGKLGITSTLPGFYAPQSRTLRAKPNYDHFMDDLVKLNLSNFEMETAAIYGLANLLGHKAISLNAILANRSTGIFSKSGKQTVQKLILTALNKITTLPN